MNRLSIKTIIRSLYTLLVVCMGFATIIEQLRGKEYASTSIYGSWWFIALWALLVVVGICYLWRHKVQRRPAVLLLHLSMVVILAGALITHLTATSGKIHLRVGEEVSHFLTDDRGVQRLPFVLVLRDFEIVHYPGSDAVMDYRCLIDLQEAGDKSGRPKEQKVWESLSISMNHIGKAHGYRFYQAAYDMDGQGTQLLVAHDPWGIGVTYSGYLLLLISLLWTIFSRQTRIRQLYRLATRPALILVLLTLSGNVALADNTAVSPSLSHAFCELPVRYNGRICPLNTAATEFVTKLSGKASWQGYSADEIFVNWMIYYTTWEQQPIIRVKSSEVQRLLGIEGQWARVSDFYREGHQYKLEGMANDYMLPDATRKAIREVDEKIQVITMFYNSEMLHLFPLALHDQQRDLSDEQDALSDEQEAMSAGKGVIEWYTPGSTELPLETPETEFQFINHAMDQLVQCMLVNDEDGAKTLIAKIRLYQREKAGTWMPSATTLRLEIIYNRLQSARWIVFLCLTLSLLFCLLSLGNWQGRRLSVAHLAFMVGQFLFLTVLLMLRWWISGHAPMSNGFETMLFMAWVTSLLTLLIMRRIPVLKAFGPVVSSLCMLVSMLAVGSPQITQLMPVLQSPLLSIHVALVMIAYALFAIITLIALRALILSRQRQYDELLRMNALSLLLLYPAVALLAIGIFVGAVWANVSWGTYWSWDPKETWALITLLIYALPLHSSLFPHPSSLLPQPSTLTPQPSSLTKLPLYLFLAFLTVLMTYFGVNYFLSGMHSYA